MKVKVLSRNPDNYLRETKRDIHRMQRNYAPELHPFEAAREYTRALNAVKLERVFAKPFLGCLDGHRDGVTCLTKHPERLSLLSSGSYDGELIIWSIASRKSLLRVPAHDGSVRSITFTSDGEKLISVGDDKTIRIWNTPDNFENCNSEPISTILSRDPVSSISYKMNSNTFATAGGEGCVQLWDINRDTPMRVLKWGVDSITSVHFNPIQLNLLASCASDRTIVLYDARESIPVRKIKMKIKSNKLCWNPMEAFHFTTASEDFNLYTFDCRNLKSAVRMHVGHTSAVLDVDYAPTGQEFVSGSYDKTLRIFPVEKVSSREVYHTKRMQRVTCVGYSLDAKYIISGSDETNIRLWKAIAWQKLGVLRPREKRALEYSESLKEKFAAHPQIRRISKHRHVPKHVYNASAEHKVILDKQRRKDINRRKHSKPGSIPLVRPKKDAIIEEFK